MDGMTEPSKEHFHGIGAFRKNTNFCLPTMIIILEKLLQRWNKLEYIKGNPVHANENIFVHDDACGHQKTGYNTPFLLSPPCPN